MRDSVATLVTVRLVYLARLRDAFGSAGETLALPAHEAPTVAHVIDSLRARGGAFAAELAPGRAVRFAVNHRLATPAQSIDSGDEVAILPPVTGG
jgi:molybdopterin synthase sulfur carrier subunit